MGGSFALLSIPIKFSIITRKVGVLFSLFTMGAKGTESLPTKSVFSINLSVIFAPLFLNFHTLYLRERWGKSIFHSWGGV